MYNKLQKTLSSFIYITLIILISFWILKFLFPRPHMAVIDKYCSVYGVDENLVSAIIKAESNFREDAVSHAEAKGIMQITDDTFNFCKENIRLESENIFDVDANIHAGVWYLSFLSEKYDENTENILAAYNAGMGNVDNWLKDPRYSSDGKTLKKVPFSETAHYVEKIKRYKIIYRLM